MEFSFLETNITFDKKKTSLNQRSLQMEGNNVFNANHYIEIPLVMISSVIR